MDTRRGSGIGSLKDVSWELETAVSWMENEPAKRNLRKNWKKIEQLARKKLGSGGRSFMINIEGKPSGGFVKLSLRKDGSLLIDTFSRVSSGDVFIYGGGDMLPTREPNDINVRRVINVDKQEEERRANSKELKGARKGHSQKKTEHNRVYLYVYRRQMDHHGIATGYRICDEDNKHLFGEWGSQFSEVPKHEEAYASLVSGLKRCRRYYEIHELIIKIELALLVKQLNGECKANKQELKQLKDDAEKALKHFKRYRIEKMTQGELKKQSRYV